MTSKLVIDGVKTAFSVLNSLGLTKTITFSYSGGKNFDLATGEINESITEHEITGVVESIEGNGQLLGNPTVRVIIDKTTIDDGDEATVDYALFDTFTVSELDKTYTVTNYSDNFYSLEMTGVQK